MPPAQLLAGAPRVVAPAPAVPLQSPPPSELMDVDPSAGPPSQAVAVQPVLQPLSLDTPKESDTAAPCPAPTQQPSTQRQETLPLFVGPDAPSRPVPEAAPVVTGVHPDLGFQSVFPEAPRSQCWEDEIDDSLSSDEDENDVEGVASNPAAVPYPKDSEWTAVDTYRPLPVNTTPRQILVDIDESSSVLDCSKVFLTDSDRGRRPLPGGERPGVQQVDREADGRASGSGGRWRQSVGAGASASARGAGGTGQPAKPGPGHVTGLPS
ncbi:uncharacterized protein LOC126263543 [Schistocerca nitens]|uniref:uncharacterized protein LOC126263543 n=1 Tax=Schistocerca nitens TaxID=7011 RepID=UPI0021174E87|nr:uncharacterized protein LOC126263543 [Schistocerca nitens]